MGGALALSGATLQALLGNPLADPFLLGVSGGAACGTLLAVLLGAGAGGLPGSFALPIASLAGARAPSFCRLGASWAGGWTGAASSFREWW